MSKMFSAVRGHPHYIGGGSKLLSETVITLEGYHQINKVSLTEVEQHLHNN